MPIADFPCPGPHPGPGEQTALTRLRVLVLILLNGLLLLAVRILGGERVGGDYPTAPATIPVTGHRRGRRNLFR